MWTAASVLACALSVLGRTEASMPPIELIDIAPPGVSAGAEAFVRRDTGTIYVITSSAVFQEASAGQPASAAIPTRSASSPASLRTKSGTCATEPMRNRRTSTSWSRCIRLGVGPGTGVYRSVQMSMIKVLDARKRERPERVLASR